MSPTFSIVICTNNGASRLAPTLAHIAGLEVPNGSSVELIVVDNASGDNTSAFTQEAWASLKAPFPLSVLPENRLGKGYAIETGYDAANHSHILTVDDDNWLAPDYLVVAQRLLQQLPDVGVLQGKNTAVFESPPPAWLPDFEYSFVIGSPIKHSGYFARDNFHVWGAGMVIERADWLKIRKLGFAFLTSKVPGKAAGEDNETAMALMLLGRKVYYSDALQYKHFMPTGRIAWEKLKMNYDTYAYVKYYFLLYALVLDSHNKKYPLTKKRAISALLASCFKQYKKFSIKQHIAYWVRPRKTHHQLGLMYNYRMCKMSISNFKSIEADLTFIKSWMLPIIQHRYEVFKWSLEL